MLTRKMHPRARAHTHTPLHTAQSLDAMVGPGHLRTSSVILFPIFRFVMVSKYGAQMRLLRATTIITKLLCVRRMFWFQALCSCPVTTDTFAQCTAQAAQAVVNLAHTAARSGAFGRFITCCTDHTAKVSPRISDPRRAASAGTRLWALSAAATGGTFLD